MPHAILRPYYLSLRNHFRGKGSAKHNRKRDLLMLLVTFIVMTCIYYGTALILSSLRDDPVMRHVIPTKLIEMLAFAFFCLLLLSNTVAAMGNIFAADNLNLFLTTPVSYPRLFAAKLIENIVETSIMLVVFLLPVAVAYMRAVDLQPGFLPGIIMIALPFLVIPASLAIVLAALFSKFAAQIWRRGGFFLCCVFGLGGWMIYTLINLLEQVKLERGGTNAIVQLIGLFENPNPLWLPSRWSSSLVSYYVIGSVDSPEWYIALLISTALGSTAIAYIVFDHFLLPIRSASGEQRLVDESSKLSGNGQSTDTVRRILEGIYFRLPIDEQIRAIILKDLTSLVRDRAQSLQLLMYLGIAAVYLVIIKFMSAALNLNPVGQQGWWAFLGGVNVLFAGFIVTAVMTRLVYPSISLEGRAFWIIQTGPLDLRCLLAAKFWCWIPVAVFAAVSLMLAGALAIKPSPELIAVNIWIAVSVAIGCTGLAIGIGSIFASFEWESPNQISSGFGTLVLLLTSLSLVLLTTAPATVLIFLATVPSLRQRIGHNLWPSIAFISAILVLFLNLFTARYFSQKGAASLADRAVSK